MGVMAAANLKSVVWKEGKHYVAQCLDIDVSSFGNSRRDALDNLQEALALYFEDDKSKPVARVRKPRVVSVPVRAS